MEWVIEETVKQAVSEAISVKGKFLMVKAKNK